jgi:hypothetical protein
VKIIGHVFQVTVVIPRNAERNMNSFAGKMVESRRQAEPPHSEALGEILPVLFSLRKAISF